MNNFLKILVFVAAISNCIQSVHAQVNWVVDSRGAAGPIAQIGINKSGGKNRTSFIAFEYNRKCDPIFSIMEISGERMGRPISQSVLNNSAIGVIVDRQFYTWHAAMTKYENGYEAGFGVTNELFNKLTNPTSSLTYITPNGEKIIMPTSGLSKAIRSALEICAARFK